ncbi:NADPH-dependent oxidoreductase [Aliifodinibius salipaludis]|uniref:NADPH-dependent oxidoreductase n=1 Tax=Fodinibius salipaludis TaxID=2032627 RepID=A0A2A2GA86_9BACT|nr:NADPH-dependent oxidoreductase [Aliifodinibius salipaludis]
MDLKIISGTDRPNSNALRVSKYVQQLYQKESIDAEIIDLQEFPLEKVSGGRYGEELPEVESFVGEAVTADALVVVCPEYNGGYPGILKLFIDYLPFPNSLDKKPIALIGEANGAFGAMRAVEQLQQVFGYRNAHIFPERVFISRVNENFDVKEGIKDDFQQQLLNTQIDGFPKFIRNLQADGTLITDG